MNASIFNFFDEIISFKKDCVNKKTKNKLVKNTLTSYVTAKDYFESYLCYIKCHNGRGDVLEGVCRKLLAHKKAATSHNACNCFIIYVEHIGIEPMTF